MRDGWSSTLCTRADEAFVLAYVFFLQASNLKRREKRQHWTRFERSCREPTAWCAARGDGGGDGAIATGPEARARSTLTRVRLLLRSTFRQLRPQGLVGSTARASSAVFNVHAPPRTFIDKTTATKTRWTLKYCARCFQLEVERCSYQSITRVKT